jgi:MinD-like ATPase involved in chromosome partitioning or flagellar assembly
MTRVFAFIGGCSGVGQTTLAAALAFEWVKRGASACILTTQCQIEAMGFDCFEIQGLAPQADGGRRDPAALAADLAQLADYDYFILDLPPGSADLAIAAGFSGATLVVPVRIEQTALGEVGAVFKALARHPPTQPVQIVLSQVRDVVTAGDAAERLRTRIVKKLGVATRLAAILPWDPDLDAMADPSILPSMALPTSPLVRAIPQLADSLTGDSADVTPAPVAMVFWEQFQTLLQQPQPTPDRLAIGPQPEDLPIELLDPVPPSAAISPEAVAWSPSNAAVSDPSPAKAPELTAELARIAGCLEQLTEEVRRLRRGMADKFGFGDGFDGSGQTGVPGEPIHLDFEGFRRSRGKTETDA